jgi:drug/metabolite transporter (DMT)-like permease
VRGRSAEPRHGSAATGAAFAFLSACVFALLNVAIRYASPYMTVWHMMVGRSLFGVAAAVLLARAAGVAVLGTHRGTLTAVGTAGVTAVTCLTGALVLLPLFEALVLLYLYPAVAALLSPRLTGDRVTREDWGWILLAAVGAALVLWSGEAQWRPRWGHLLAVSAAVAYGSALTLIRRVSRDNSPVTPYFYMSAVGCIVCAVPLAWHSGPVWPDSRGLPALAAIALLAAAAHLCTNRALRHLPSPVVGVVGMSEAVFGGVLGYVLFDEPQRWHSLLGGVLILSSGVRLSLGGGSSGPRVLSGAGPKGGPQGGVPGRGEGRPGP